MSLGIVVSFLKVDPAALYPATAAIASGV